MALKLRGAAAMGLTAAASAFLVLLLCVPGLLGKCTSFVICALKGTTMNVSCTYYHPSNLDQTFWSRDYSLRDIRQNRKYAGRVEHNCGDDLTCTFRITDLRERDTGHYRFMMRTKDPVKYYYGDWVSLTVTDVQMQVTSTKVDLSKNEAELKCVSSCSPAGPIYFIWVKNGQRQQGGRTFSGRFLPGDEIYCALYRHNDYRSPSLYAPVAPVVTLSVSTDDIVEGSSVTLSCGGNGDNVNISWHKKDGNGKIRAVGAEPQLVFESIKSSDSGEYYCRAESQLGSWSSESISVEVKYPPRLPAVSMVPSGDIVEGSTVTVTCSSDANPAASYSWYKENQKLPETQRYYNFSSIRAEHKGTYRCKSGNSLGTNSSSVVIDVLYPPRRPTVSMVPSGNITVGSTVNLTCSSDANPAATYSWFKENQTLQETQHFYTFSAIRAEHKGTYHCESANSLGNNSSSVVVDVLYPPRRPSVSMVPSGVIVEGSKVTLTCISDANIAATYSWFKDNQKLPETQRYYNFSSIRAEHKGTYRCESEDSLGTNSSSVVIDVLYPPRRPSVSMVPSGNITVGSKVTLTCSSDANPAANYIWFKENQILQEMQHFYTFSSIRAEHKGTYRCKSENSLGNNSASVVIDVLYPPRRPSVSVVPSGGVTVGSTVTVTCSSDANPAANYSWFKKNESSPTASGHTFIITKVTADHTGDYYCEATNSRGSQRVGFSLPLMSVPDTWIPIVGGTAAFTVSLGAILVAVFIWIRRRRQGLYEAQQRPAWTQQDHVRNASVHFSKRNEAHGLDSNMATAGLQTCQPQQEDGTEEAMVQVSAGSSAPSNVCTGESTDEKTSSACGPTAL